MSSFETFPLIENIFHLTLVYNQGVAFGFFRGHPTFLFVLITASLVILFIWSHSLIRASQWARWSMGLILGGAIGNWIDRLRLGAVIDFLDFRIWPVFNIADSCITTGVILYFIFLIRTKDVKPSS